MGNGRKLKLENHAIELQLKLKVTPTNIHPFKYPYFQKDEIEKPIWEMFMATMIQSSVSLVSSFLLLVKKKDCKWHFCVDY